MSVGTNVVKVTAKTALKDNWLNAIIASLIPIFTIIISTDLAGLSAIVVGDFVGVIISCVFLIFLTMPVVLGLIRYIWRMLFSVKDNPLSVFYWFSSKKLYFKATKFIGFITLRMLFWFVVLNIPTILIYVLSKNTIFDILDMQMPVWTANFSYLGTFLMNASIIVLIIIMLKYYMAPILLVADENMEPDEAIHMSVVISKKTTVDFIYLIFSFFHWILLSILVLPLVFTLPYMLTAYAVHTRFSVAEYNGVIKKANEKENYSCFEGVQ